MFPLFGESFQPSKELSYSVVVGIFIFMILFAFGLAALTLWTRWRREGVRRERMALTSRWDAYMFEILAGRVVPEDITRLISRRHQAWFLDHVAQYAVILRGRQRDLLESLAQPFLPWARIRLNHRDAAVRAHAFSLMSTLGAPRERLSLLRFLSDSSTLVAMLCARYFIHSPLSTDREAVMTRLERFSEWNRYTLIALLVTGGPLLAPLLRPILTDSRRSTWVRVAAAEALTVIKDTLGAEEARAVCREIVPPDLTVAAIRLLGVSASRMDLPLFRSAVTHGHPLVRAAGLDALSRMESSYDLPVFILALNDGSPWVVVHALQGLKRLGRIDLLQEAASAGQPAQVFAQQMLQEKGIVI